jgi:hypothetical protein
MVKKWALKDASTIVQVYIKPRGPISFAIMTRGRFTFTRVLYCGGLTDPGIWTRKTTVNLSYRKIRTYTVSLLRGASQRKQNYFVVLHRSCTL